MDLGDDFESVVISFVDDSNNSKVKVSVFSSYIEIWDNWFGTPVTKQENHTLTFANNLQLLVRYDGTHNAHLDMVSNGVKYSVSGESIKLGHLKPCLSVSGSATNIRFSVVCEDANKDIWMFGDSYFSNYGTRWVSHLMNSEYKNNVLINAYSGANSTNAYKDLKGIITQGTPKYIFWCLGMNDGSDTDINTPAQAWYLKIIRVIDLCKRRGITPVFATIPTVPNINHEAKNKWERESGYQYVDFAKSVGATSTGEWYGGMLSSDNVHPSSLGALALYHQVLTDFPQIMIS
jgi:lysophospholipase L1-like esterase